VGVDEPTEFVLTHHAASGRRVLEKFSDFSLGEALSAESVLPP
jgi:hypothetical protein